MVLGIDPVYRKLNPVEPSGSNWRWLRFRLDWAEASLTSFSGEEDMADETSLLPIERIEPHILLIRGEKVMLDSDLAELYGVSTKVLNQAVKRNRNRFPDDFMFQLTAREVANLRSQFVTSSDSHGGRRYQPYAFTEQGVAMLSSVLRSPRAVQVNVQIMRTFVRLRKMLSSNAGLAKKLAALESKYDQHFKIVFDAIRGLMEDHEERKKTRKPIGYLSER